MASNNSINNQALNGFTASGGTIDISSDAASASINIGFGSGGTGSKTIQIGNQDANTLIQLESGSSGGTTVTSQGSIVLQSNTNIKLQPNSGNPTIDIYSGTGTISISDDAKATTVNVATGLDVKTLNLGSTNGASITTIQAGTGNIVMSGGVTFKVTSTNTSPYVATSTDYYIAMDSSGAPKSIQLPDAPALGRTFSIKDATGSAATNNITITTVGGVVNIDGATSYVMNAQYESVSVFFNGTSYLIF